MTRLTPKVRRNLIMAHGLAMMTLGFALFYIRATMTNLFFYVFAGAFAVLLLAASLLFIAVTNWICAAGLGRRQVSWLRGLLFVGSAAAALSVFLILYPGASMQMLCYAIAAYALALGAGKLSFARYWTGTQREQRVMYFLAGISFTFSASLIVVAITPPDDQASLAVIGVYALFMGFQMLLTMQFLKKQALKAVEAASGLKQASV
jgi:hypothetical protein